MENNKIKTIKKEKQPKTAKEIRSIVYLVVSSIIVISYLVLMITFLSLNPGVTLVDAMKDQFGINDFTKSFFLKHLPVTLQSIMYIVLIFAVSYLLRKLFKTQINRSDRVKTVVTLLDGIVKYGAAIIIILLLLTVFGVDTGAILASVGVLTLVIGLGAQTLIADIIAGMFIIFENEYNTGEIIAIDGFRGKVIEIGIRTTKLLDSAGNIKIINHSAIHNVVNLSRELSLAVVDCDFPYDVPIEHIEKLIQEKFKDTKNKIPAIVDGPYYKGVAQYKDSNVTIRIVAQCKEEDRYQVQRDLLREYRSILTNEGIDIAYPHIVIDQAEKNEYKLSKKDIKNAQKFVDEQKILSEELDKQDNE